MNWILDLVRNQLKQALAALWLAVVMAAPVAAVAKPLHTYGSGFSQACKLGNDLYETLDPTYQKSIYPEPIQVEQMEDPVIVPSAVTEGGKSWGRVSISAGYVDLLNHLAHAKAIDRIQPGFFQTYVLNLSKAADRAAPPAPPDIIDNRYWTVDVMNDQGSYFNQMIGMTLAINFSHYYLGNFNRYSSRMPAGQRAPFNNFIPPDAWETESQGGHAQLLELRRGHGRGQGAF